MVKAFNVNFWRQVDSYVFLPAESKNACRQAGFWRLGPQNAEKQNGRQKRHFSS